MDKNFRQQLYNLAQAALQETVVYRSYMRPFDASHLSQELYQLACRSRGVLLMPNADILPTFFDEDATEFLLAMPNLYWFWATIKEGVIFDNVESGNAPIGLQALKLAVQAYKRDLAYKHDMRKKIDALTPAQLCSRTALGIVLIVVKVCDTDEIVFNPLFAEED